MEGLLGIGLKLSTSWPFWFFALIVVIAFIFRNGISAWLGRTKGGAKVKVPGGASAEIGTQEPGEKQDLSATEQLSKTFDNALLVQIEDDIRQRFKSMTIPPGDERDRFLIRYVAGLVIALSFERIYKDIWGSQIEALELLNTGLHLGRPVSDLEVGIYKAKKSQCALVGLDFPDWPFESWLNHLKSGRLITVEDERAKITLTGREFLKYLTERGYAKTKSY